MILRRLLYILLICLSFSCTSKQENDKAKKASDFSSSLPLPRIPADVTEPEQRSEYAVIHFWDALDIQNKPQVLDTAFIEQSFSNFTAVLPYAREEVREKAVRVLLERCKQNPDLLSLMSWVAYKYLDDPNSPMRSEEMYIPFLKCLSEDDNRIPEQLRERTAFRLAQAMKNRPGSMAPDFRVSLRGGGVAGLRSLLGEGENLLMFYDSDCPHCKEVAGRLAEVGEGSNIIAVDVAGDPAMWEARKDSLPAAWIVAYDLDGIEDKDLYYIPALPTFYLLDASGKILMKDPVMH